MTRPRSWPTRLKAVLFDLDGVLASSFEAWVGVMDECRQRRDLPPLGAAGLAHTWGQGIEADCELLFPGTTPEALIAEYDAAFPRHVHRVQPMVGVASLMAALTELELDCWVVTNSPGDLARAMLHQIGLGELAGRVTGGDDVARGKPDPEMVRVALEHLKCAPAEAILVGDTVNDLHAGRGAGVTVIGLGLTADLRIENLPELEQLLRDHHSRA